MRIKELDGLRGIAALSVMLFHYTNERNSFHDDVWSFSHGHYGVELFFILSGFVISMSLLNKDSLKAFSKARFFRLFPIYWFCVTLTFIVTTLIGLAYMQKSWSEYVLNLTMIQRFLGTSYVDGAYWSLQYELFFYLIISILFYMFRCSFVKILQIFLILSILSLTINLFELHAFFIEQQNIVTTLYFRLYGIFVLEYVHLFMVGIALYAIRFDNFKMGWIYVILGIGIALSFSLTDFVALLIIVPVFVLSINNKLSLLQHKYIQFLGAISYVLYMIHMYIGRVIIENLIDSGVGIYIAIFVVITIIITTASAIHLYIEKPLYSYLTKKEIGLTVNSQKV